MRSYHIPPCPPPCPPPPPKLCQTVCCNWLRCFCRIIESRMGGAGVCSCFHFQMTWLKPSWRSLSADTCSSPTHSRTLMHTHAHSRACIHLLRQTVYKYFPPQVSDMVCAQHRHHITRPKKNPQRCRCNSELKDWIYKYFSCHKLNSWTQCVSRRAAKLSHCVRELQASLASSSSACVNWICVQAGLRCLKWCSDVRLLRNTFKKFSHSDGEERVESATTISLKQPGEKHAVASEISSRRCSFDEFHMNGFKCGQKTIKSCPRTFLKINVKIMLENYKCGRATSAKSFGRDRIYEIISEIQRKWWWHGFSLW